MAWIHLGPEERSSIVFCELWYNVYLLMSASGGGWENGQASRESRRAGEQAANRASRPRRASEQRFFCSASFLLLDLCRPSRSARSGQAQGPIRLLSEPFALLTPHILAVHGVSSLPILLRRGGVLALGVLLVVILGARRGGGAARPVVARHNVDEEVEHVAERDRGGDVRLLQRAALVALGDKPGAARQLRDEDWR